MEQWTSKVAVVTGASSGVGISIIRELVRRGMVVAALAKKKEKVQELGKALSEFSGKLHAVECDVSKENSILGAFAWIRDQLGTIDVLVNNAGMAMDTTLLDGSMEQWRNNFNVNVVAPCLCAREAVRSMREGHVDGLIIHVNVLAGERVPPPPGSSMYAPTKRCMTPLAQTLRHELKATKIRVTNISPGIVAADARAGYSSLHPDDVAGAMVYILSTPPHVQVHDISLRPLGESI